jgi:sugar lactone lactonase YvrE
MAMDAAGNVYIADARMDRVRVVSAAGELVRTIGRTGSGPGRLRAPEAVAVAASGDVYVADTGNSRVSVFKSDGTFSATFGVGMLPLPSGIAIGTDGSVYVSDRSTCYARKFSASGTWLADYTGGPGVNPGQGTPRGIAVTADTLYVVDSANARVSRFRLSDNAYLGQWGHYMVGSITYSRYNAPTGMTLAPDGQSVLIADTGNHRIERCDLAGTPIAAWGSPPGGSALGQLSVPRGAVIAADGTLYIADTGNSRISRADASGWLAPWQGSGSGVGQLSSPQAVATDDADNVYVADTANNRIQPFSAAGTALAPIGSAGSGLGQLSAPSGVAVGTDGYLYVADTGNNRVQRYSLAGNTWEVIGAGQLSAPHGIAFNVDPSAPEMYVADTGNNRIAAISLTSFSIRSIGTTGTGAGQLMAPEGVATDPNGRLWVADTANSRIQSFNVNSGAALSVVAMPPGTLAPTPKPTSVAAMGYSLAIADPDNGLVQVLDTGTRQFVSTIGAAGEVPGPLHAPVGVATPPAASAAAGPDCDKRIVVVERDTHRVQVLEKDVLAPTTAYATDRTVPTSQTVTVTLTPTDAGASGPEFTWYRLGSSAEITYTAPFQVTTEGATTVTFHSADRIGNAEAPVSRDIVIDRTKPVITVTGVATGGTYGVNTSASWTTDDPTATDSATLDGVPYSARTIISTDGPHELVVTAVDPVGNSSTSTVNFSIDSRTPFFDVVNDAASATAPLSTSADNVAKSISVRRLSAEPVSTSFSATLDGAGVGDLASAAPVTGEGRHTLTVTAVNVLGNSKTKQYSLVIDNTKPDITITGVTPNTAYATRPLAGWSVADANAVPTTYATIDGVPYSSGVPIGDGVHTLVVTATDVAGNTATKPCVFTVDTTQPYVASLGSTLGSGPMVGRSASFEWSPGSDLTGISGYSWVVDQNPNTVPDTSIDSWSDVRKAVFDGLGPGTWYFHLRVCDAVGNWSATAHTSTTLVAPLTAEKPRLVSPHPSSTRRRVVSVEGPVDVSAAGSCSTRVLAYHYEAGRWVLRRSATTQVIVGAGPARYRCSLSLAKGDWRIFAVNESSGARPLHTGFASVRVR